MDNLLRQYNKILETENFQSDPEQEKAVEILQGLLSALMVKKSFWPFSKQVQPRGVYMYGGVGRGKSMLMDLFFDQVPDVLKKRRVHFHEFMIETHDWLHAHRGDQMDDLLPSYARHVSEHVKLLCFDEFHVTDVADAMILGRLFTALLDSGVIVVTTSNWEPDRLYEGGLQRELFLPFIALLKEKMDVVHLDSGTDYRTIADPDQDVYYFSPLHKQTADKVEALFFELTDGQPTEVKKIEVKGRVIEALSVKDVARFTFSNLCEKPLGAEDYIAIATQFDTVFIEAVPRLGYDRRNEAKRLILLIDCLYEAECRLVMSAQNDIHKLYHGSDHAFEFDRTVSRLMEMQSGVYHEKRMKKSEVI